MRLGRAVVLALHVGLGACGSSGNAPDGAPPGPDAAGGDADVVDADVADAMAPAREGTPGKELVTGGARVTGGSITMDVQVGHGVSQRPTVQGSVSLQGASAVKP